jgi:hypothetical protein
MDWVQITSIVVSVTASIIPAIWFLSAKIQGLSGELRANAVRVEEKVASIQYLLGMYQVMLKEAMAEQEKLRERVAVTEARVEELRTRVA